MGHLSYYQKDKAFPMIINLLSKEGHIISNDNIKSWSSSYMNTSDVIRGINRVKSLDSNIIIYTNTVSLKDKLSKDYGIKILDNKDLKDLASKHGDYDLYDLLN